jgi:hypothetical protein
MSGNVLSKIGKKHSSIKNRISIFVFNGCYYSVFLPSQGCQFLPSFLKTKQNKTNKQIKKTKQSKAKQNQEPGI